MFCPSRRFFTFYVFPSRRFLLFDVLSQLTFLIFELLSQFAISIRCFVPFGVFSFDVLSVDVLYRRRFLLRRFVGESPPSFKDYFIILCANLSFFLGWPTKVETNCASATKYNVLFANEKWATPSREKGVLQEGVLFRRTVLLFLLSAPSHMPAAALMGLAIDTSCTQLLSGSSWHVIVPGEIQGHSVRRVQCSQSRVYCTTLPCWLQ